MKQPLLKSVLAACFAAGSIWSTALADEGGLTVPATAGEAVKLVLAGDATDINPKEHVQVFVGQQGDCCAGKSPISGRYKITDQTLAFAPLFDFVEGQDYTIRLRDENGDSDAAPKLIGFNIAPATAAIAPEVTGVYPSGDTLPENVLRFYIHFSTPMQPHVAFDYIQLVDASGAQDDAAFMQFKQELWSADRKRLTVLMDPGRIKRGVAQNMSLGPALLENEKYSLIVKAGWPAATGSTRISHHAKPFSVSSALRTLPDVDAWNIDAPPVSTQHPLKITFDRPFDYELLHSSLTVQRPDGRSIPGTVFVDNDEMEWRFEPSNPWDETTILVSVHDALEDVAGNNFRDLLDHSVDTKTLAQGNIVIPVVLRTAEQKE